VKVLGYILTAAAILVGADVFVMSGESQATDTTTTTATSQDPPSTLHGGNGYPTPPPD
jgi:hypothetical protein